MSFYFLTDGLLFLVKGLIVFNLELLLIRNRQSYKKPRIAMRRYKGRQQNNVIKRTLKNQSKEVSLKFKSII